MGQTALRHMILKTFLDKLTSIFYEVYMSSDHDVKDGILILQSYKHWKTSVTVTKTYWRVSGVGLYNMDKSDVNQLLLLGWSFTPDGYWRHD